MSMLDARQFQSKVEAPATWLFVIIPTSHHFGCNFAKSVFSVHATLVASPQLRFFASTASPRLNCVSSPQLHCLALLDQNTTSNRFEAYRGLVLVVILLSTYSQCTPPWLPRLNCVSSPQLRLLVSTVLPRSFGPENYSQRVGLILVPILPSTYSQCTPP
jgi:hypothetical protein